MPHYSYQQELADSLGISLEELNRHLPCYMNRCDGHFVVRINGKDGSRFFGCSNYPTCKATRSFEDVEEELTATIIGEISNDDISFPRWDQ